MSEWDNVIDHANAELAFTEMASQSGKHDLPTFYPELYDSNENNGFTNSLGSHLIADLLTSDSVVVDLYDWPDEETLISVYGVDLNFLLQLRDAKLVKLAANLPPQRYKNVSWLHHVLAHESTIWRSIRTPALFQSFDPTFEDRRKHTEKALEEEFRNNPEDAIALYDRVGAVHPPSTPTELASTLSHWLERVAALEPEISEELRQEFEENAFETIPYLRQVHRLVVSPYSAALGGTMKLWRDRWTSIFGEHDANALSKEGILREKPLFDYLTDVEFGLTASDLGSADVWTRLTDSSRRKILDFILEDDKRNDLILSERTIRNRLASQEGGDTTREEIRDYLNSAEITAARLENFWEGAQIATPIAFGILSESMLVAMEVGIGVFFSRNFTRRIRPIVEGLIPELQVVRVLRKR